MAINKRPIQKIKKSRNSFDMSQRQLFTSSVGHCLPVYYDLLSPGDKIKLDSALLTRTQQLKSNPLTRVTEHIDYFFVPYKRIFSNFNQWFSQMTKDVHSPLLSSSVASLPSIDFNTYLKTLPKPSQTDADTAFTSSTNADMFGVLRYHNAQRLLDLLGYGVYTVDRMMISSSTTKRVNPALICAYHAINYDFYRLTDRELPNINLSCMDDYANNLPDIKEFLNVYYRPWKRDFYTNLEVSPLFGGYTDASFNTNLPQSSLYNTNINLVNTSNYTSPGVDIPESASSSVVVSSQITTDSIRRNAALERLSQLQRLNDKYWNAQLSALFGLEVPDNYDHVIYLGSHHSNINTSDVVATATTDDSTLGEIAGKGLALPQNNKPIEFETKQHGFIMAIYSATPLSDYVASGIDRINQYSSRSDFYNPAYDNLGMQPKYQYEADFDSVDANNANVLGWTYRWQELKSKPDLIHGAFAHNLNYWVTARSTYGNMVGTNYKYWCIAPNFLDTIMLVNFITTIRATSSEAFKKTYIDDCFGRDPLLHELYFKVYKFSNMSEFSLPRHNEVML